ncbi:hypothetical protein ACFPL7_00435 [Dongia soli]|uniref:Uncharacterized protein n=1 Tax=Dongia soli TaxID=600628 RepID=A0ABU5EDY2_9PROT|nr:hypothetical protein [Dongia soli]MDY0884423.1 hypothetical protein [Dongia soli]
MTAEKTNGAAFERRDVAPQHVVYAVLGLFAIIIVAGLVVAGLLGLFDRKLGQERSDHPPTVLEKEPQVPPQPRLQVTPAQDRASLDAEAEGKLQGYGWMDRNAGRAHIPIDRAIDLLVAHGWPTAGKDGQP